MREQTPLNRKPAACVTNGSRPKPPSGSQKAAEKNDFERAIAAAKEAEALAKASIFQATSEKEAWKNLEIR